MSYILDALKKADAERERDAAAVPDLYAQPEAGVGRLPARGGAGRVLVVAAAGLLLAALAWWWFGGATSTGPPPATARMPEPAALPALPTGVPPAPIATPMQAPIPVTPPRALPAAAPSPATVRAAAPPSKSPAVAPVAPTTATATAAAASAPRLPTLAELPPGLRAQMPTLVVGGSVYSTQAASRMVILGGQVFREGDRPAEGLLVEQIGLKSTVLSFRGQRFELKH